MADEKKRIIIAHPGRQHSYRLISALEKSGMYEIRYITTIYDYDKFSIIKILKPFLSKENKYRASNRKNPDIPDSKVVCFFRLGGIFEILLSKTKNKTIYFNWRRFISDKFGIKVAKFAIKFKAHAVICYDTNASSCFKCLEKKTPQIIRILDSAAANKEYMSKIYNKDIDENKSFSNKLRNEVGYWLSQSAIDYSKIEARLSHFIISPSCFVQRTYTEIGVSRKQIKICPYGVDLSRFRFKKKTEKTINQKIEFVYTGGTKQLKGISYLLEAFSEIPNNLASLRVIGKNDLPVEFQRGLNDNIIFSGVVLNAEIPEILESSDVFLFASLGEGMSLSILEAMACGLPIVCTENSGANDFVEEGLNGFVVKIQDKNALKSKIEWFIDHRKEIPKMGEFSARIAEKLSWNKYEQSVLYTIDTIFSDMTKYI